MRAVDTNLVVRLIVRDDPRQVAAAERFVAQGAWVSLLVLQEVMWVLDRAYGLSRDQQILTIELLLEHEHLTLDASDIVRLALQDFRSVRGVSFPDCLIVASARASGHTPLGSFDRRLARLREVQSVV